jgi:hypothetical protein
VACFGYEDVVFYADSELAGDVYAGLYSDYLAGLELTFAVRFQERVFVDFQSEAVTCAVAVNGQAGFVNYLPGGGINFCDFYAGLDYFYRRGLGLFYYVIDLFVEGCHATSHEASRNVAAIAVVSGAEVDKDGVFLFEFSFAGLMVRPRAVRAEGDYRLETVACPEFANLEIKHSGQLALAYAGLDIRQELRQRLCRNSGGGFDFGNLAFVLDAACGFDNSCRRFESGFNGSLQLFKIRHRDGILHSDGSDECMGGSRTAPTDQIGDSVCHRTGTVDDFAARTFFPGLLGVSAVGKKIDPATGNDRPAIFAEKAGKISDICRPGDEQETYLLFIQLSTDCSHAFCQPFRINLCHIDNNYRNPRKNKVFLAGVFGIIAAGSYTFRR